MTPERRDMARTRHFLYHTPSQSLDTVQGGGKGGRGTRNKTWLEKATSPSANANTGALDGKDPRIDGIGGVVPDLTLGEAKPDPSQIVAEVLEAEPRQAPFYLRYRLLPIIGVALSASWIGLASWTMFRKMAFSNILDLLPHEQGGLAAGILTPVALIWMVVALFERGRQLRGETAALRWQLERLAYPSERAEKRVREITDSLTRQARILTRASEDAMARARAIDETIQKRLLGLARVSEDADIRAQAVAEALRRQTDDLRDAADRAVEQAAEVGDVLSRRTSDLTVNADRASARAESLAETLHRRAGELADAADRASERTLRKRRRV